MQILLGRPLRCIGCVPQLLNEQSPDSQQYRRKIISVVFLISATLIVGTAASWQHIAFIPNGACAYMIFPVAA